MTAAKNSSAEWSVGLVIAEWKKISYQTQGDSFVSHVLSVKAEKIRSLVTALFATSLVDRSSSDLELKDL